MPYNRVIAIGDSFTRGDELADCPVEIPDTPVQYSQSTWPALIAKSLNYDYKSYAIGGRGNQWISMSVSTLLEKHRDALFIINWSWFERFDYVDIDTNEWTVTHPRHDDKLDHYFYKHVDHEQWNLHRNLQQIHSTISLLDQNNIDFIMTCMDPMLYTKDSFVTKEKFISPLQEQILPSIVDFEGMSFLEWSKHNSFELGPNGHPLEQAHTSAADYIQKKVKL